MHKLHSLVCWLTSGLAASSLALTSMSLPAFSQERIDLQYAPAAIANPLKGLVPYAGKKDQFPHSMEFNYVSLADLVKGYDTFDWTALERLLDDIAGRGHQTVFRIYLEYPGKTDLIPKFLIDDGLKVHKYLNTNTQPFDNAEVETPDYENPNLRRVFKNFIAAFGEKYDGDPRIGFITAGLLGTWGEWHTYPRGELFASKMVQAEVMDAYQEAFKTTRVLLRYPAGKNTWGKAPNFERPFGYHDDSFAWATLDTGKQSDNWFYMPALLEADPTAIDKWKTQPIGGEIRPEAWGKVFDAHPGDKNIQDFRQCVDQTHASWLMDSGMFRRSQDPARRARAELEVQHMGYEFHVSAVTIRPLENERLAVRVEVENRGVAPFYYDWPIEFGLIADGKLIESTPSQGTVTGILPGEAPRQWNAEIDCSQLPAGMHVLALRVANPLPNGQPIRFANTTQDQHLTGWLSLREVAKAQ